MRKEGLSIADDFVTFISRCDNVEISNDILTFTGYKGERSEYHGDLGWWEYDNEPIFQLMREYLAEHEITIHELSDDEIQEIISEEMEAAGFTCGEGGNGLSDYDTVYYTTDFHEFSEEKEYMDKFLKDNDKVYYIEVYPYRYGTYSGVYDMSNHKFTEFCCDGDSSPCGGPDVSAGFVGDKFIPILRKELSISTH